ncbi:hypothetical protein GCM10011390_09740 [Aureimonas endophytica]|uniref:Glycosyl transferase family 25 domain-containing protein n=1 Tax=Aureimonas endophytica TaxID=2027858 RepID=A0A917E1N1_9HYPH|nr:glycosyltransferase family 25 protein [Aureimonas endophytica]GGD93045.1 hypothetical protein GCM10011390_09740 [Aureimonas endophytica]
MAAIETDEGEIIRKDQPRIRFINLDTAEARRRYMEGEAARLGLAFERLPAVSAATIAPTRAARLNGAWERPLTDAELGCFLSHETLWRDVAEGDGPMLILEDDVMLSARLPLVLPALAATRDVDVLNLESFDRRRFVGRATRPVGEGQSIVRLHRDKSGSAAYLLWPSGARKLLARAERGAAPVDAFLHGLKGLVAFQAEPALAMQFHIMERRGRPVPLPSSSSIQAPRRRLPLTVANLPFHRRRLVTQAKLAGEHLMRLFGRRYRVVDIDEADFAGRFDHSRS